MIVKSEVVGTIYRASALQYFGTAFNALGSRLGKGRFDRPGITALYLALELETAYSEFQGGRALTPRPCAIMTGTITARHLLDLTLDLRDCDPDIQAWNCDWEAAAAAHAVDPTSSAADCASWRCGDLVIKEKLAGVYYPSTKRVGGLNLAIFVDHATVGDFRLDPHDPLNEIRRARLAPS